MYLGDGYISHTPRTYRLEVSLYRNQKRVIARVASTIATLRPGHPVGFRHRGSVMIVNAYANTWPILFPQHEVGRKHQRPIILEPWQRRIASWPDATIPRIPSRITRQTSWTCSSGHAGWLGCVLDARTA